MRVYAGIDEAGYGPMFGPLTVGRCVLLVPNLPAADTAAGGFDASGPPDLWRRLNKAVCRRISEAKQRIAVNDSKLLTSKASGVKHLERGVLCFLALMENAAEGKVFSETQNVNTLLGLLGETCHREEELLPWYAASEETPWQALPTRNDAGALALDRGLLRRTATRIGVSTGDMGVAVVFEDKFNERVALTRSKAAVSFTCVGQHLRAVWDRFGAGRPVVVVDRQGGRTRYRDHLATVFPEGDVAVVQESADCSVYEVVERGSNPPRRMAVRFETGADGNHMPVALASMTAKYVRELMMHRFQAWFAQRCPDVKPTAGYGTDANRFGREIAPHLAGLGLTMGQLRRRA